MQKTKVAVFYGSRSVEHEVSVVTAMQVMSNLDKDRYEVIPVYLDKQGKWWTGEELTKLENYKSLELGDRAGVCECRLEVVNGIGHLILSSGFLKKTISFEVAFLAIHGTHGEDGTLQGLMEMYNLPYTGSGVMASALGMDKVIQKGWYALQGLPVVTHTWMTRYSWDLNKKKQITEIEKIGYPVFVKPANLGSSVGISKAKNQQDLVRAIEIAFSFDNKIIVEEGLENIIEINCSVMGNGVDGQYEASVCEQPVKLDESILSYEDKYMRGGKGEGMAGLTRLVPAPIEEKLTKEIQEMAIRAFSLIGASGLARVDFLVDPKKKKVYVNEINTLPGSLAFYLWEKSGYDFSTILARLITMAEERAEAKKKLTFSIESGLLEKVARGSKN